MKTYFAIVRIWLQRITTMTKKNENPNIKDTLLGGFHFLFSFLKNPILIIKKMPAIPIGEALLVQLCFVCLSGVAMGFMSKSLFTLLWGIFIYPFLSIVVCAISSLIIYYMISYLTKRNFSFEEVYILVFLASIPAYLIRILYPILNSIDLIGLAISSILLRIGLVYSFALEKKQANKIVLLIYGILFLGFLIEWLNNPRLPTEPGFKISL